MKKTHDIVATVGKYTNREGEEKKRYVKIGAAFGDDEGRLSLKIDAFPCSPEWSGWLSLYPVEREGATREQNREMQAKARPPQESREGIRSGRPEGLPHYTEVDPGDGDEIPF